MLNIDVIKKIFKNRKAIILLVLIILMLVISGFLYYLNYNNNEANHIKKVFKIYKDNSGYPAFRSDYYISDVNQSSKDTKVREYTCDNSDCEYYYLAGDNVPIYDGAHYIYNFIKDTKTEVELGNDKYQNIDLLEIDEKLRGIIVYKNDKCAYYSLEDKRYVTDFNYDSIWMINVDMFRDGYMFARKDTNNSNESIHYVFDIKTGEVMIENIGEHIEAINNNGYVYYLYGRNEFNEAKIYNSHFKLLFDGNTYSMYEINDEGNLIVANDGDNVYKEYDSNGLLLSRSKTYNSVDMMMEGSISVVDSDNYLKVVDYSGNVLLKIVKFTNDLYLHTTYSGISKESGTLVVENKNIKEGETGHCRYFHYEISSGTVSIGDTDVCYNAG